MLLLLLLASLRLASSPFSLDIHSLPLEAHSTLTKLLYGAQFSLAAEGAQTLESRN